MEKEPPAKTFQPSSDAQVEIKTLIERYMADDYPNHDLEPRPGKTRDAEARNCKKLIEFWGDKRFGELRTSHAFEFRDLRMLVRRSDKLAALPMNPKWDVFSYK